MEEKNVFYEKLDDNIINWNLKKNRSLNMFNYQLQMIAEIEMAKIKT